MFELICKVSNNGFSSTFSILYLPCKFNIDSSDASEDSTCTQETPKLPL